MTLPLSGLKVLDFSSLLPGPYASRVLADLGAEVIRIESPHHSDTVQHLPPFVPNEHTSYAHLSLNRNKSSLCLDLKTTEAQAAIKQLVKKADIVLEQFRPGVMQRLGLDYPSLSAINPGLIYCSLTGYGQEGETNHKAGHDINYLALSGLASYGSHSSPALMGTQVADIAGAHYAAMGIMAAVIKRHSAGHGDYLDISMTDAAFSLNALFGPGDIAHKSQTSSETNLLNGGGIYGYYTTSDQQTLAVGALELKFARVFFDAIGHPEWLELIHGEKQTMLKAQIAEVIAAHPLAHWCEVFAPLDACVEPVLSMQQAAASPLMAQRNMLTQCQYKGKAIPQIASPFRFASIGPLPPPRAAPEKGQHNAAILSELGLDPGSYSLSGSKE